MSELNQRLQQAQARLARLEPELTRAYERLLAAAARKAVSRFRSNVRVQRGITAAVHPDWTQPDPSELIDSSALAIQANGKTRPLHERALRLMGETAIGISFDVTNPFAGQLIDQVSAKASSIIDGFPDLLQGTIRDAHEQGLSVAKAASLLEERGLDASRVTAQMLARTSLNAISNGSSLLAAQMVASSAADIGEQGPRTKTWVTAGDERVRDTHADTDGQTVPLDQPFDVGGEQLMYPGDPNGSDAEVINCRCTVVYGDDAVAAGGIAPTDALQSPGTVAESLDDTTLTAAATGSTDLPLSGRDEAWDAAAARKSLNPDDYAKAHFWRDPEGAADQIGSYKLPFAKRTGDGLVAVWRGITAGAQRLSSTQIPAADKKAVQGKMSTYYAKARKEYDDDTIEAPFAPIVPRDFHLTAAAGEPTRFTATLLEEGVPTEDGRMIAAGASTWRGLPLPLMFMDTTDDGHDGAVAVGRFDQIWRAGSLIQGSGVFNDVADPAAARAVQMVRDKIVDGISVDPVGGECEVVIITDQEPDADDEPVSVPGEQVQPVDSYDDVDYLMVYTELVIGGATICPFQAVANARIELVAGAAPEPVLSAFAVTECTVAPSTRGEDPVAAAAVLVKQGLDVLATAASSAALEPVMLEAEPDPRLDALIAAVDALSPAISELVEKRLAAAREEARADVRAVRNELFDTIKELGGTLTAALTASAEEREALAPLLECVPLIRQAAEEAQRARELVERKPRQVQLQRDKGGKLIGAVEA